MPMTEVKNPMGADGEVRTSLTGQPLQQFTDNKTSMMYGDGGAALGGDGFAGANLLPHGYTDKSLVNVPIKASDLGADDDTASSLHPDDASTNPIMHETKRKGSLLGKLSGAFHPKTAKDDSFKIVMMSRGDYLKYWVKGDDGKFKPSVQTPPEGRRAWYNKQLELNEQWKRDDPELSKKMVRSGRGIDVSDALAFVSVMGAAG